MRFEPPRDRWNESEDYIGTATRFVVFLLPPPRRWTSVRVQADKGHQQPRHHQIEAWTAHAQNHSG